MKTYIDIARARRMCRVCKGDIIKDTKHIRIEDIGFKQSFTTNLCPQCCPLDRLDLFKENT